MHKSMITLIIASVIATPAMADELDDFQQQDAMRIITYENDPIADVLYNRDQGFALDADQLNLAKGSALEAEVRRIIDSGNVIDFSQIDLEASETGRLIKKLLSHVDGGTLKDLQTALGRSIEPMDSGLMRRLEQVDWTNHKDLEAINNDLRNYLNEHQALLNRHGFGK
ncbi:hypothetical protein [Neptuniibacter sp. QD37_11]|uniref:hypothetical protein n=1 Tax=Neptuniibacter sp. QD37_11 TaxID=3398209 RepID=UPI0039F4AF83